MQVRSRFLSAVVVCASFPVSTAFAADLGVPGQFPTIQSAINAAANGDRVLVAPGTYSETISVVSKSISIIGTGGANVTRLDRGNAGGDVVAIQSVQPSVVNIQGVTITRWTSGAAISISGAAVVNAVSVWMISGDRGISLTGSSDFFGSGLATLLLNSTAVSLSGPLNALGLSQSSFQGCRGANVLTALSGGLLDLDSVSFFGCTGNDSLIALASGADFDAADLSAESCTGYSNGLISVSGSSSTCSLTGLAVVGCSGAQAGVLMVNGGSVTVDEATVMQTGASGGPGLVNQSGGSVSLSGVTADGLSGFVFIGGSGGLVRVADGAFSIRNSEVRNTSVVCAGYCVNGNHGMAGGMFFFTGGHPSTIVMDDVLLSGLSVAGGAPGCQPYPSHSLYAPSILVSGRRASLRSVEVSGSTTTTQFVGLIEGSVFGSPNVDLTDCRFAGQYRPVVVPSGSVASLTGCRFVTCEEGLVVSPGGQATVSGSDFAQCPRAILAQGSLLLRTSTFRGNTGGGGSAVRASGPAPDIQSCLFQQNTQPSLHLGDNGYATLGASYFCGPRVTEIYRFAIDTSPNTFNLDCSLDCDVDGFADRFELLSGREPDCNANGWVDSCDIESGRSEDADGSGIPDECEGERPVTCRDADLFEDSFVNGADLGILLVQWGPSVADTIADLNGSGSVDGDDLGLLLTFWGPCP